MFKQEREKKINRDKKDKKIRFKLDFKNNTFEKDEIDWRSSTYCYYYSDINTT